MERQFDTPHSKRFSGVPGRWWLTGGGSTELWGSWCAVWHIIGLV